LIRFRVDIKSGRVLSSKLSGEMDQPVSIFDEIDEEIEARAIEEARADVAAGRVVPHERVREWLLRLAKGEKVPPPTP
jgi:predicted transcriptional regulator